MSLVSKMKPRGIQLRNRSRVSSVAFTSGAELAVVRTSLQSWNMAENSAHMVVFRFFALVDVIWS